MPLSDNLAKTHYDVAIIGGGINGAAIARDAAMRGMKVILFEKEDFGSGASAKTSKLAHGGLRYLEHYKFGLVKESLDERFLLLKNAPHLVTPLSFVVPVYAGDPYPLWQLRLALKIYDHLDRTAILPRYRKLTAEEVLHFFPAIKKEGLKGGCLYYDALMKDNRLILENVLSAEQNGAIVCNYTSVMGVTQEQGHITGLEYQSSNGVRGTIKGRSIVNTTGAWSNHILQMNGNRESFHVQPTKGVHVVLPQISSQHALILRVKSDQRIFFLIPWEGNSLLGTTDTFYDGNPDHIEIERQDEEYLLRALSSYFPQSHFPILASFAGLRPLVGSHEINPSSLSRNHEIHVSPSGLISILGGKYTTHRKIAQEVVDKISRNLKTDIFWKKCQTQDIPFIRIEKQSFCQICIDEYGLSQNHALHLFTNYGENAFAILDIIKENPQASQQICPFHPHLMAEISHAILHEHACTLEDWFLRRTSIAYSNCQGKYCLNSVADKFSSHFDWSETTRQKAVEDYLKKAILNH